MRDPQAGGPLAPSRLDELRKRYEENPRRFFAPLANELRKSGDLDQAISLCQEHLESQPGNMNGHVVYGQALFDAGRYPEADATFTTALSLDPENLIVLRHLGDISRLGGDAAKALEWYTRVLDADPRNEEILSFIDEVKATLAAGPPASRATPSAGVTPAAGTVAVMPVAATPAVAQEAVASPAVAASEAPTIEFSPPRRSSKGNLTPIAPVETVPIKRPSVPLIDVDIDFASEMATPVAVPPVAPPQNSGVPGGDIELSNPFGEPTPAATEAVAAAPPPAAPDLQIESALGWDMGTVDLAAAEPAHAEGTTTAADGTPPVFVTETMAELYLQQGFRDEALQVYRQLADMNPNDESLQERIRSLEGGSRSSLSLDRVANVEPDFAPGTDGLVPMRDAEPPAPPEPPEPERAVAEPAIAETAMDSPTADFDLTDSAFEPGDIAHSSSEALDTAHAPTPPSVTSIADLAFDDAPADVTPADAEPAPVVAPGVESPPAMAEMVELEVPGVPAMLDVTEAAEVPDVQPVVAQRLAAISRSARSFFATLAQRRPLRADGTAPAGMAAVPAAEPAPPPRGSGSVDALFGDAPPSADDAMARALATAVGVVDAPSSIRGRPTKAAASEFSLDSVFRGETALRASGPIARQSEVLKFDQFFASGEGGQVAPPPPPAAPNAAPPAAGDDAQFQSWLQGLKNP